MEMMLTRELAYAAGRDADNRSMRDAGRSHWNRVDYNRAAATTNRLMAVIDRSNLELAHA